MITTSDQLLAALDAEFGFPNETKSSFRKIKQTYDNQRQQHVIWIEYTVKVFPGQQVTKLSKVKPKLRGPLFRAVTGR
jgi:hypothetical protein